MNYFLKYKLNIIVFICGASVMILELVGSRVLAPYVGTSTYVWTTLIGIILGSLSFGYYIGGKLADKQASYSFLSKIILISSVLILFVAFFSESFLHILETSKLKLGIKSIIAVTILFTPSSIFLGIVSPYSIKLKLKSLDDSGKDTGTLYAISTIGSITGTFLAGYVLIPLLGTAKILYTLAIILVINSILTEFKFKTLPLRLSLLIIYIILALYNNIHNGSNLLADVDTEYNRVWIYDYTNINNDAVRKMQISNESSSSMYLYKDQLVYDYTNYYKLIEYFKPDFKNTLMIGGAGYSFPKYYLANYENKNIDVVEIDPKVTELAKKYFHLVDHKCMRIIHEDGRTYLNMDTKKYDAILIDAYKSYYTIPYHLTTFESCQKMANSLTNNGVMIINIISSLQGEKSKFLQAELKTLKKVFPQIYLIPVGKRIPIETSNIMLIALKSNKNLQLKSTNPELNNYLKNVIDEDEIQMNYPVLTDDYAPIDFYTSFLY